MRKALPLGQRAIRQIQRTQRETASVLCVHKPRQQPANTQGMEPAASEWQLAVNSR